MIFVWFAYMALMQGVIITRIQTIDVMVLVNTPVDKINSFFDQVSDCAFEYLMKYRVDISPVIKNIDHFNYWKNDLPY